MESELLQKLGEWGVMVTLVVFFVWQAWVREARLYSRIDKLEDEIKGQLAGLVDKVSAALERNTNVIEDFERKLCK